MKIIKEEVVKEVGFYGLGAEPYGAEKYRKKIKGFEEMLDDLDFNDPRKEKIQQAIKLSVSEILSNIEDVDIKAGVEEIVSELLGTMYLPAVVNEKTRYLVRAFSPNPRKRGEAMMFQIFANSPEEAIKIATASPQTDDSQPIEIIKEPGLEEETTDETLDSGYFDQVKKTWKCPEGETMSSKSGKCEPNRVKPSLRQEQ